MEIDEVLDAIMASGRKTGVTAEKNLALGFFMFGGGFDDKIHLCHSMKVERGLEFLPMRRHGSRP